jgi:WD40 repeat protein
MRVKWLLLIGINFFALHLSAQETIFQSNKAIRSFLVMNDTIYYSNNDHLLINVQGKSINKIYVGGYLIDFVIEYPIIMSLANNYKQQYGTVRRFDLKQNRYSLVYNIKEASPMLSYCLFPTKNDSLGLMISYNNGNLNWHKSTGELIQNVGLFSKIREIKRVEDDLFFCTDNGEIFKTNGSSVELVFKVPARILGFKISNDHIYCFDDKGNFLLFERKTKTINKIKISPDILLDFIKLNENIFVFGDWKGRIITYDNSSGNIQTREHAHKKMVLKLQAKNMDEFYSSGQDGALKLWKIKSF